MLQEDIRWTLTGFVVANEKRACVTVCASCIMLATDRRLATVSDVASAMYAAAWKPRWCNVHRTSSGQTGRRRSIKSETDAHDNNAESAQKARPTQPGHPYGD